MLHVEFNMHGLLNTKLKIVTDNVAGVKKTFRKAN